ncbi:hypothetical protein [Haloarcula laminariae]|uniref:hypothetical protein n=1 Tax=Haloarcula laminariae TaxID=2961577 RepID=UPI0024056F45|nr:hypothetical protein [Halomicroarcula sp. FL173]
MKRRNLLATLGALTGVGGVVGTGAFTSVSAGRRLAVKTEDDNNALLRLEELGQGERSIEDGDKVKFRFPSFKERVYNPGLGLGSDSVYEFDRDADASDEKGLLEIENQGTQPVDVYSEHQTDSELEIELYDVTDPDKTALRDDPVTLDVGEHVDVGFRIRTFDADIETFNETLTVVGEAP